MPAPQPAPNSPPTNPAASSSAPVAGSSNTPPPLSPSSSSSVVHQLGSRHATRTRTRTRRNMSSSASGSHRTPRYSNQHHPLAAHNLAARGYHSFRCLGVPFHVKQRYTFVRELGIGAYGCVALCRDELLDINVAIKKVTRIFEKDVLARRALREVALLRHIGMCDNVTFLLDFDTAFIDFSEIYLVLSASEADLSQIIRSGQSLSDAHHQYFMAQILRGVRYMHAANVIHRDLKPSNLLVNGDCALRICDFGLARSYADANKFPASPASNHNGDPKSTPNLSSSPDADRTNADRTNADRTDADRTEPNQSSFSTAPDASCSAAAQLPQSDSARSPSPASDLHAQLYKTDSKGKQKRLNYPGGPLTGYVATRWYRAPEVMLCFREGYGPEMDMWSVGCILAELIAGAPIFGGKDYVDQIARINNVLGSPSQAVLDKIGSERAKTYIKSLPNMPAVPLDKLYPNANPEALDLISKLLTWDPDHRLTAEQALHHPWLKAYHESNARWQPPQSFDKFADVEFIHSFRQFRSSIQREADEMRLEFEELEREEMEHLGHAAHNVANGGSNGDQAIPNGKHHAEHREGDQQQQPNAQAEEINRDADTDVAPQMHTEADSGNVQRADDAVDHHQAHSERASVDADALHSHFSHRLHLADQHADELSCNASTQSSHLPADTASSSSSIHTPSSTSGASADEAEPASPRLYESCGMSTALKSRAEHLEEGKALRKPPSFFRLGHEAEGRLFGCFEQEHNDVFMPYQVLTVARGLVEYQTTAAAARDAPPPSQSTPQHQARMLSRSSTIKASSVSSSARGGGGAGHGGGQSSRPGAASTPSLAQSLLDHTMFTPAPGSSNRLKSTHTHRHAKQLVILQDSLVQSSVSLVRELIHRSTHRNHAVILITTLRRPETYLDGMCVERIATVDATALGNVYAPNQGAVDSVHALIDQVRAELVTLTAGVGKATVLVDSLNAIVHAGRERGVASASRVVRETLGLIGASSRLVVGLQMGGVEASTCAGLLSALHSPLIWGSASSASGSAAGGTVLSVTLHPPALVRHIVKQYGLKPPSSSTSVQRSLGADMDDADDEEEVDARFWDVLRNVASRGAMGVAGYEAGGSAPGWWSGESCAFEPLSITHETRHPDKPAAGRTDESGAGSVITLADVLNPLRTGYVFLELHYQARNGKQHQELVGLATLPSNSLDVVALDMTDRTLATTTSPTSSGAAAASGGDAHSSMMSTLPFNLGETSDQRQRRETVRLPFAYHQNATQQEEVAAQTALRGNTGNAKIFFEPEDDDDEDDEDPDDDLDV